METWHKSQLLTVREGVQPCWLKLGAKSHLGRPVEPVLWLPLYNVGLPDAINGRVGGVLRVLPPGSCFSLLSHILLSLPRSLYLSSIASVLAICWWWWQPQ